MEGDPCSTATTLVRWKSSTPPCAKGDRARCCTTITNTSSTTEGKRGLLATLIRYGINFAELVAPVVGAAQTGQPVRVDGCAGVIDLPAGRFVFPPFPPAVQALLAAGGLIPALARLRQD